MNTQTNDTRARAARCGDWIAWHAPELAAVVVPALLAWLLTPWLWLLAAAVAAAWAARSVRQVLRQRRLRAERQQLTEHGEPATSGAPARRDDNHNSNDHGEASA